MGLSNEHKIDAFTIASAFLYEYSGKKINPLPISFKEHLKVIYKSGRILQFITDSQGFATHKPGVSKHSGIICLWREMFDKKVPGPKACDVYGFSF